MRMKKLLSALCAAAVSLSVFVGGLPAVTLNAYAEGEMTIGASESDFTYTTNLTGVTITKYKGSSGDVIIPSTLGGKEVTEIGEKAFYWCKSLTSVTIPNSVTTIGYEAFMGCSITDVTIPDGVTVIGEKAFYGCENLTSVTIRDSVNTIGISAFSGCKSLTSISVDPNNPSYASASGVLYSRDGKTLVAYPAGKKGDFTIPDGVTVIGENAFYCCANLTSVTIPDGITVIGDYAFISCANLTSVTIPDGITEIGNYAFGDCGNLANITIPDSVTQIGKGAFFGCRSFTSITIPSRVNQIGDGAFTYCTSLLSISVDPNNPSYASTSGVLYSKDGGTLIAHPGGKNGHFTIPDSVIMIGNSAFDQCIFLKSITLPNGVTEIGDYAFRGCLWFTSVMLPDGVISIGLKAFFDCHSLTSITIPDGVTKIGDSAFSCCIKLTSVTIPDSVTEIGNDVFKDSPVTIYGYAGSRAESYANENNIPFVDLTVLPIPQNIRVDENNNLLWDCADGADGYEISFGENTPVIKCDTNSYSIAALENGAYTVRIRATNKYGVVGDYSDPFEFIKHEEGLFDKDNELETPLPPIPTPEPDRITSITINPAFNMKNKNDTNVELDLTKIKIKAQEIYDEVGLKRAEEALGKEIIGNKHYNLLDLTLLYNDQDFSNGYDSLVQVIIPLPTGHRDKTFSCYRLIEVDGKMTKEVIPGEQTEDSYIIYLEHFSEYALVADGGEEAHTHTFSAEWKSDSASHWHECACGEKSDLSAHTENSGVITTAPTTTTTGVKTYSCTVCGYVTKTETVDKLEPDHTHAFSTEWKSDSASHWHECACGEKSDLAAHTAGEWITNSAAGYRHRDCIVCGAVLETESLSGGKPSVGRPPVNPTPTAGTANSDNSVDSTDPKDEEEPEADETDGEDDVDEIGDETDDDADDDSEGDFDDSADDDSYDDTASKDDTEAAENEVSAAEVIARDENPATGAGFGGVVFVFLGAGAAALVTSKKGKKHAA